ncbi:MAG: hypothetical protein A3B96_02875 [Candidatus Spechtbacteria bacterium RIFCSPHIGHO2_02_FULL_43_15b]|uniref:DUF4325 domain-containing protein n=1 Tax=Candidatus Spechtbacteria bacterium RIFCSPHIGHO2_01_FULL_43_30 TaxID=1802158 RepID=A0A1G2H4X6_9BACT|nr:MAG: hypothetical protein A2827_01505 [Candidatus Spechtbacteria bacterium RIFCSPHIGHO2_01_FULL_43_30]OGZ59930.1 MAG: hypothetical protein A3B96_02875 [Candidatus Spechtbacteria bacterium RIFCSPHIGHO2_02_FULL_43_15b]
MTIYLKKFGNMLISRPAGREAWLGAKAYVLPESTKEKITLDFEDVDVLTPSWADEFIAKLIERQGKENVNFQNTDNPSVKETLRLLFG